MAYYGGRGGREIGGGRVPAIDRGGRGNPGRGVRSPSERIRDAVNRDEWDPHAPNWSHPGEPGYKPGDR